MKNIGPVKDEQLLSFEASKDTELDDFYCIEVKPGLKILKMGVIYGPNASGKTTILEGIELLRQLVLFPLDQKDDTLGFEPFLFDNVSSKSSSILGIKFFIDKVKYDYEIEFDKHKIINESLFYYPNGKRAKLYVRFTEIIKKSYHSFIDFGSKIGTGYKDKIILEGNTLSNNTVLGAVSKSNAQFPELEIVYNWFSTYLQSFISPHHDLFASTSELAEESIEIKNILIKLIQNADFHITDFEVQESEEEVGLHMISDLYQALPPEDLVKVLKEKRMLMKDIIFHHKVKDEHNDYTSYKLKSSHESRGTLRYYGLSGVLASAIIKPTFVSIDEIETSLHPDLMKQFILTFLATTTDSQLLFTTHNVLFLSNNDILRNDVVWFTEKQENGATDLYSLNDFDSKTFRRKYNSVFNAYNVGKLGAKPKIGNIFLNFEN
ncbi:ATP-binding protein [Pontibacter sp. JH31]|uniref:ATP-binding protein n=1 Tax=Pontibacter aquaedesilientis TaxID=2766980 RepID=A0ABR7XFL9_9BACT|nr:ATP-binding protein [Pontibacter aquaedesilientis]MBD1397088.1 ATP-binding protein [Pontibacter aquaedesilientis]